MKLKKVLVHSISLDFHIPRHSAGHHSSHKTIRRTHPQSVDIPFSQSSEADTFFLNLDSSMDQQGSVYLLNIGYRVREIRLQRGLSQKELAKKVGCSSNTISGWEMNPNRGPNKRLLGKVAQSLNVSLDYLLNIEKIETCPIPCYGHVSTVGFSWTTDIKEYIEVMSGEYFPERFALKILDDFLEPVVAAEDYAIFEKSKHKDGDILVVRFPENNNEAIVKKWRQKEETVVLLDCNPYKTRPIQLFYISRDNKDTFTYIINQEPQKNLVVEGKLIGTKKTKSIISYRCVAYEE